jgi:hypothetical protein
MRCPGQDTRYWGPEAIGESGCPNCGASIEFFKDESSRRCRKCGAKVFNPKMDFGCASYCKFASQCLGTDMPPELLAQRADLLKDRVAAEVKKFLGRDFKRIGRALKIVEYAGKIQKSEGGDPAVVTMAACLAAIAAGASSATGIWFSAEEIAAAESILSRTRAPEELAREVISILSNLGGTDRAEDSVDFRCVFDAVLIAVSSERLKAARHNKEMKIAPERFLLTPTGRSIMETLMEECRAEEGAGMTGDGR